MPESWSIKHLEVRRRRKNHKQTQSGITGVIEMCIVLEAKERNTFKQEIVIMSNVVETASR